MDLIDVARGLVVPPCACFWGTPWRCAQDLRVPSSRSFPIPPQFVLFSVDSVRSNPRVVCRLDHGQNHPPRRPTRRLPKNDCLTTHSFKPPMPPPPRVWFCFCSWVGSPCFLCVPGVFSCGAWAESREADFGAKSAICYVPVYKHPPGPCMAPDQG